MTAVKLGPTQWNHDGSFSRTITGTLGTVAVRDAGPPFFSGTFLVEGMGNKSQCRGLGEALSLARTMAGATS